MLRALRRLAALLAVLLGGSILLILSGARRRRLLHGWARAIAAVLRVRVEVHGAPPRAPFLLVANHLSYLDVIVLASQIPGCVFVAKAEVRRWPFLGPICAALGTLFVDRGSRSDVPRVLAAMEEALARGLGVIVFPEGTSTEGATVGPFRSPLLAAAARLGRPVHAAVLRYREPAVCWWGDASLAPHLWSLLKLPELELTLDCTAPPVVETDRKLLAERLRERVLERFPISRAQ
jgi:1-acyl-sn-glycerol-3-phosphate acyltransferase